MDISQILLSPPPLCQKQEPCCTFLDFISPFWWTPRRKKQEHEDCIFPATSICIKYAILMFVKGYHYPFLLVGLKSAKKHPGNGQCPNKCSVWKHIKHIERWFLIPVCVKNTYLLKHHKNCECSPGHPLTANHQTSGLNNVMNSHDEFLNLSGIVNCAKKSLNRSQCLCLCLRLRLYKIGHFLNMGLTPPPFWKMLKNCNIGKGRYPYSV